VFLTLNYNGEPDARSMPHVHGICGCTG